MGGDTEISCNRVIILLFSVFVYINIRILSDDEVSLSRSKVTDLNLEVPSSDLGQEVAIMTHFFERDCILTSLR
jgi:hypothetical protein